MQVAGLYGCWLLDAGRLEGWKAGWLTPLKMRLVAGCWMLDGRLLEGWKVGNLVASCWFVWSLVARCWKAGRLEGWLVDTFVD